MKTLLKAIDKVSKIGASLAALALVLMFALGLLGIILRDVLGISLDISLEYTGYLVAFSFLMGSGWAFREGRHVRLDLVNLMPGTAKRLEILVHLIALGLSAVLAFGLISWTLGSYELGSVSFFPSATPLWIPQGILAIGPVILFFSVLGRLLELLTGKKP